MADLEQIGLAKNGKHHLDADDLKALLSGRRTDMLRFENLKMGGLHIDLLDAKLSLKPNADGLLNLSLHPVYPPAKKPEYLAEYLTDKEAEELERGDAVNIEKDITDQQGRKKNVLVEYDPETREFIVVDTDKILAPDMVNGEYLSLDQQARYLKGKEVSLADGTIFRYSGTDNRGVLSNRPALVAANVIDGDLFYFHHDGLRGLDGKTQQDASSVKLSNGYYQALKDLRADQAAEANTLRFISNEDDERSYSGGHQY